MRDFIIIIINCFSVQQNIGKYSCDRDFGVYNCSNIVSLAAVPIMHQEIVIECRDV